MKNAQGAAPTPVATTMATPESTAALCILFAFPVLVYIYMCVYMSFFFFT